MTAKKGQINFGSRAARTEAVGEIDLTLFSLVT